MWCHLNGEHGEHWWRDGVGALHQCVGRAGPEDAEPTQPSSREPGQAGVTDAEFPIIPDRYRDSTVAPHPMKVPWSIAELAYSVYVRHGGGDQSLERLAERGGFGAAEMDKLLPDWRERVADLLADRTRYQERIGELEKHNVKLQDTLSEYMLAMAKPAEGFKNEEEYVRWQRAVNHWESEARALLEGQDEDHN